MNCLDFRRRLGAEPHCNDADFLRHRQDCPGCAEAQARALAFEQTLRQALAVPPPAELAEAVLLAHATRQQRLRRVYRRGALLALAASLVLAFGIGLRVEARPLTDQAVEHLRAEAVTLTFTQPVTAQAVRDAFASRGLALREVPDGITFVACCPMGRHRTVHLVMSGEGGAVSVIYVVDVRTGAREDFQHGGWQGRSVPLGAGTLILLAQDGSRFDAVERAWRAALDAR
jgi:hypothetical protein